MDGRILDGSGDMSSPLKHFTNAKKRINNIFLDIGKYIGEFSSFIDDVEKNDDETAVVDDMVRNDILASLEKVNGIKDMISRNHMKVVFFGRTSNGKSSVINAMLWDKILPSGIGHTTNCFLSIAGCNGDGKNGDDTKGYLLCGETEERRGIGSVTQLSHALSQESMSSDSQIQIFWPKTKCPLLKDDVVLVDSPGIDVSSDIDQWIDNYCLDADVFILVANAESTLMLVEKKFFHQVNEKLSKPNIFILNNRWDASASEPELMEEVRQQHLERGISFLADELKVVTKQQAKDRVFFVSAKEALQTRRNKLNGKPDNTANMAEGHQARLMEFAKFEHEFEECISQSATRTKFEYPSQRASRIIDALYSRAQWLHERSTQLIQEGNNQKMYLEGRLEDIDFKMKFITQQCKESIANLATEAERQVRRAMTDEIRCLPMLVDEFQRPFHPNHMVLRVYKSELYKHVDEGLGRNLSARCSSALQKQINKIRGEMIEMVRPLLIPDSARSPESESESSSVDAKIPGNTQQQKSVRFFRSLMRSASQQPTFDMSYDIDCASLCADFQEDVGFRFSLGFTQLMARFMGNKEARRMRLGGFAADASQIAPTPPATNYHPGLPEDHVGVHGRAEPVMAEDVLWSLTSGYFKFTQSHSTFFVVFIGMIPYVLWKAIGWRAVAFSVVSYGALYAYERLTWTSNAKEKMLKRQFVEHAGDKLNLVITFTSSNCSHQVQQELSGTFAQLCSDVEDVRNDIQDEIQVLLKRQRHFSTVQARAKTLRNKAGWLASELDSFSKAFLSAPPVYQENGTS
ncbi:mitofusin-2-like [Clavelina lepadiformis]